MRIWYDTEFLEDGKTIELLSIGIVRADGQEYYAVISDADWDRVRDHEWLMANVVPSLPGHWLGGQWHLDTTHPAVKDRATVAREVEAFLLGHDVPESQREMWYGRPELWAWYAAYDHVALCQLWGRMIDLPQGVPMWTNDLRQEQHRLGNIPMPDQPAGTHNALMDARHNRVRHQHLEPYLPVD